MAVLPPLTFQAGQPRSSPIIDAFFQLVTQPILLRREAAQAQEVATRQAVGQTVGEIKSGGVVSPEEGTEDFNLLQQAGVAPKYKGFMMPGSNVARDYYSQQDLARAHQPVLPQTMAFVTDLWNRAHAGMNPKDIPAMPKLTYQWQADKFAQTFGSQTEEARISQEHTQFEEARQDKLIQDLLTPGPESEALRNFALRRPDGTADRLYDFNAVGKYLSGQFQSLLQKGGMTPANQAFIRGRIAYAQEAIKNLVPVSQGLSIQEAQQMYMHLHTAPNDPNVSVDLAEMTREAIKDNLLTDQDGSIMGWYGNRIGQVSPYAMQRLQEDTPLLQAMIGYRFYPNQQLFDSYEKLGYWVPPMEQSRNILRKLYKNPNPGMLSLDEQGNVVPAGGVGQPPSTVPGGAARQDLTPDQAQRVVDAATAPLTAQPGQTGLAAPNVDFSSTSAVQYSFFQDSYATALADTVAWHAKQGRIQKFFNGSEADVVSSLRNAISSPTNKLGPEDKQKAVALLAAIEQEPNPARRAKAILKLRHAAINAWNAGWDAARGQKPAAAAPAGEQKPGEQPAAKPGEKKPKEGEKGAKERF